ncbi:MAG: D-glycero-beta-D-manno-heptose-7-phosphate kinase [Mariniphaga sp.]|nr:D-glycero-beta-D-manno-heptose-7-phosphate kinase [Mariniphaga sp.]
MEKSLVEDTFERFENLRVLILGDAMVDAYLWGKIERISPEAPIPIVTVTNRENRLGGAANVSLNIQALGATPILFSVIGDDARGRDFLRLFKKRNLSQEGIFVDQGRKTTVKNRVISNGQHIARIDEETIDFISEELEKGIFNSIKKTLDEQKIDVIVFVDYDKGVITTNLITQVTQLAKEKGILTAADPKIRNFKQYREIDLFKPNFNEFRSGTKFSGKKNELDEILKMARDYKNKKKFKIIFITLSELGVLISNGAENSHYPANIRYIADVSGAGDTVISVACLCLAAGLNPDMIANLSNMAGGLVCEKVGVVPIDKDQLKKEFLKMICS